jgi:Zn-dependent protease with chaperone function
MDFFDRQEQAHRRTKWLVVYFVLAVASIMAAVYLAALVIFGGLTSTRHHHGALQLTLWNPRLLGIVATSTLTLIVGGSLYKTAALSGGGRAFAASVGGQLLNPGTQVPAERRLLNVVEEMAIASGIPVPPVYVLSTEPGINAFAAGYSPQDAVIGVTRGCLTLLNRDELQGVIGHEFSHILNGDMRLNLRLIGLIFGILCLATIGRILLRTSGRKNAMPIFGLALIAIGAVGVFFGRLIQAAVSRQREFLADASAVQFTRNPAGLSGALQKIGGLPHGSRLNSEHAADACHMFFGNALRSSFLGAMATHPPLAERIRAVDPSWDGAFPRVLIAVRDETAATPARSQAATALPPVIAVSAQLSAGLIQPASVLPQVGKPSARHLSYAVALRDALPDQVRAAAREPCAASALIYALLISPDVALRASQLEQLKTLVLPEIHAQTVTLLPMVCDIAARARLPLVAVALPALGRLQADEFDRFMSALRWLIASDKQIDLFEFTLTKIIRRHLEPQFVTVRPPVIQYYALKPLLADCAVVLSALAQTSSGNADAVASAFQAGASCLRAPAAMPQLLPADGCGITQIDSALNRLAQAAPQIKRSVIEACVAVVSADGLIHESEAELLRAVADVLDCPIPPFVPSDFAA